MLFILSSRPDAFFNAGAADGERRHDGRGDAGRASSVWQCGAEDCPLLHVRRRPGATGRQRGGRGDLLCQQRVALSSYFCWAIYALSSASGYCRLQQQSSWCFCFCGAGGDRGSDQGPRGQFRGTLFVGHAHDSVTMIRSGRFDACVRRLAVLLPAFDGCGGSFAESSLHSWLTAVGRHIIARRTKWPQRGKHARAACACGHRLLAPRAPLAFSSLFRSRGDFASMPTFSGI